MFNMVKYDNNLLWFQAPGNQFAPGYNKDMGDQGILTKSKLQL